MTATRECYPIRYASVLVSGFFSSSKSNFVRRKCLCIFRSLQSISLLGMPSSTTETHTGYAPAPLVFFSADALLSCVNELIAKLCHREPILFLCLSVYFCIRVYFFFLLSFFLSLFTKCKQNSPLFMFWCF